MKLVAIKKKKNNTNNNKLRLLGEKGGSFPKSTEKSQDLKFSANTEVELFQNLFPEHSLRISFVIQWNPEAGCSKHG